MSQHIVYFLVLGLFAYTTCERELSLKIIKCTGDYFTPVSSVVEEKAGANFSLFCDLVSSKTNNNYYDFQISWIKQTPMTSDVRFWKEHGVEDMNNKKSRRFYSILSQSEMNKAIKKFQPLRAEDRGKYICVSLKYGLHEVVEVRVREDDKPYFDDDEDDRPIQTFFCSEQMFQCANGVCIIHHYICDGKADCKDGSDESEETCNGDPCKDKLRCDDGRCIPTSWCCDRHHDPNCTVTVRPKCCQILSESYEELEFGSSTVSHTHNGTRYVFISVCILSILFVIVLLLLILSKVVIFAKKTGLQHTRDTPRGIESIALHNQTGMLRNCRPPSFTSCDVYTYQNNNSRTPRTSDLVIDSCDVSDPLLYPVEFSQRIDRSDEQPPPYVEVVRAQNLNEPPPPYTSREVLNDESSQERD